MSNTSFLQVLKKTAKELEEKNKNVFNELNQTDHLAHNDPEHSSLHCLWQTYRLQTEFKEFVEGLLTNQYNTSKAS